MNRSILLVICDFFILTLLSFVQFDSTTPERGAASEAQANAAAAAPASAQVSATAMTNMLATLESALSLERQQRETLTNQLALTQAELDRRLQLLAERELRLTNTQERLQQAEFDARRLAEERAKLDQARAEAQARVDTLQQAFESTRRSTDTLQNRLIDSTREAEAAKARLGAIEEELGRRRDEAREMQQRITKLDEATENLRGDKEKLLVDLRQTEAEARVARYEVTNLNRQLTTVTEEKTQLAQTTAILATNVNTLATTLTTNVTALAEQSSAIQERIERQTRLPANTIYGEFLSNRIETAMSAITRGGLGQEVTRDRSGASVIVRRGTNYFAVLHIESSALRFWPPDAPWSGFSVHLERKPSRVDLREFSLVRRDPRIVLLPVTADDVAKLGVKAYEVAPDPSQFAEAVVVGAEERYYGETAYRLNAERPGYVEMERSTFRRILGEFSPRKGDLAFTRTGQLLGILVNGDHCLLLDQLETLPAFICGPNANIAQNAQVIRTAFNILEKQPYPLR